MHHEIIQGRITFFVENAKKDIPHKVSFSCTAEQITNENLSRVCTVLVLQLTRLKPSTQRNQITVFLKPLLAYFAFSGVKFPYTSDEWQIFLLCFFQFFLTNSTWSQASSS